MISIALRPEVYVVAVSGGVDSVALLDILSKQHASQNEIQPTQLIVAHFDHGIRADSHKDRQFVAKLAKRYGYPFVYGETQLGSSASEEAARTARYDFLRKVKNSVDASIIVTAHHQDDALETAVFNLLRGTGRHGVVLQERSGDVWRPLLPYSKDALLTYAKQRDLKWREDITNQDTSYSRNYIRNILLKRLTAKQYEELNGYVGKVHQIDADIEKYMAHLMHVQPSIHRLDRQQFAGLPHVVAKEFLVYWLRQNQVYAFDKSTIERLCVAIKTGYPDRQYDVVHGKAVTLTAQTASLKSQTRKY